MCGRYTLDTPIDDLAEIFGATPDPIELAPRFNIAPTEEVPAILHRGPTRRIVLHRWGLIPSWAGSPAELPLMINARSESLETRPSFRDLLADRRCLVPADGFYEWRPELGHRQPYLIRRRDRAPMTLAALWDEWRGPDAVLRSLTIVTTGANELLGPLHERMPVIVDEAGVERWLDPALDDFEDLRGLLEPFERAPLEAVPVSRRINRISEDDASCRDPVGPAVIEASGWNARPGPAEAPQQLPLL